MNEYIAIFKMKVIEGLQYRAAALAGVATQFFWGFMSILIFYAFYQSTAQAQPMEFADVVSYMWLRQAFLLLFAMWTNDNDLTDSIVKGHVAYEYCRPYDMFWFWYARLIAGRLSAVMLRCLPILIFTSFLPAPWNLLPPDSVPAFFLFLVSLCLAMILSTAISMFYYISTFYTLDPRGSRALFVIFGDFFTGALIPIPLMPVWLQNIMYALPFAYTADMPFRVYSGHINSLDALLGIGVQLMWITLLLALGKLSFKGIRRKAVIQGG